LPVNGRWDLIRRLKDQEDKQYKYERNNEVLSRKIVAAAKQQLLPILVVCL